MAPIHILLTYEDSDGCRREHGFTVPDAQQVDGTIEWIRRLLTEGDSRHDLASPSDDMGRGLGQSSPGTQPHNPDSRSATPPTWNEFYDEVCRCAEANMLKTGKLEGAHYAAMNQVREEWSKAEARDSRSVPPTINEETIDDGFGSVWSVWCGECGRKSMYVCRPGDARCSHCYDGNPFEIGEPARTIPSKDNPAEVRDGLSLLGNTSGGSVGATQEQPVGSLEAADRKFAEEFVEVFGGFPRDQAITLLVRYLSEIRVTAPLSAASQEKEAGKEL